MKARHTIPIELNRGCYVASAGGFESLGIDDNRDTRIRRMLICLNLSSLWLYMNDGHLAQLAPAVIQERRQSESMFDWR